eukprot:825681_1
MSTCSGISLPSFMVASDLDTKASCRVHEHYIHIICFHFRTRGLQIVDYDKYSNRNVIYNHSAVSIQLGSSRPFSTSVRNHGVFSLTSNVCLWFILDIDHKSGELIIYWVIYYLTSVAISYKIIFFACFHFNHYLNYLTVSPHLSYWRVSRFCLDQWSVASAMKLKLIFFG